ncbi:MAG: DUF1194 domain-containing protein [Tabrizicola sp.]|jgi:hypothetical protein|nr:DUF1194 domain-containing protein [Tabrizicola sp.]
MKHFNTLAFTLLFGSGVVPSSGAAFSCADLALVLAIDSSGSINDQDFALQQAGYAKAFTDRQVQAALAEAGVVDVAVVFWGDEEMEPQILPWRRIADPDDATRLAVAIAGTPRRVTGDTGIGRGLWTALDLLEDGEACAARRIVNVSGDGKESFGPRPRNHIPLAVARERATEMGVTVNALAITVEARDLQDWYLGRLITGPDAFVVTATSFEAFGEAIIRKLAREIALPALAAVKTETERHP